MKDSYEKFFLSLLSGTITLLFSLVIYATFSIDSDELGNTILWRSLGFLPPITFFIFYFVILPRTVYNNFTSQTKRIDRSDKI